MGPKFICLKCRKLGARAPTIELSEDLSCAACGVVFPRINGIPFLFEDPASKWYVWQQQLIASLQSLDQEAGSLNLEIKTPQISRLTYDRIHSLKKARNKYQSQIAGLLKEFLTATSPGNDITKIILSRVPITQELLGYTANIFRDWVWGDEENKIALDQASHFIDTLSSPEKLNVLFLGSGSSRFALDVQRKYQFQSASLLDFNPYLLSIPKYLMDGLDLELVEFPKAPKDDSSQSIEHTLKGISPVKGVQFVLADATKLPFDEKSFDLVIMPWFIDILPSDAKDYFSYINPFIKDGGSLLHQGSLAFFRKHTSQNYLLNEYIDLAVPSGFEKAHLAHMYTPYLNSPYSNFHRNENVHIIGFRKTKHLPSTSMAEYFPDWIINPQKNIPKIKEIQQMAESEATLIHILNMIDGKKSIRQISEELAKKNKMDPTHLSEMVRLYLAEVFEKKLQSHRLR